MTYNPLITEEEFLTLVKLFTGEDKVLVSKKDLRLVLFAWLVDETKWTKDKLREFGQVRERLVDAAE